MSNQKNTPKDPTQELLDHEPAVFGTSQDDMGDVKTTDWPTSRPKSDFSPKQQKVVEKWANSSQNGTLEREKLREWSKGKDFSLQTVRRALFKAFPDERDINNFTMAEKLAIGILARNGEKPSAKELAEVYPISKYPITFVQDCASDLISEYRGKVTKSALEDYIEEYKEKNGAGGNENNVVGEDSSDSLDDEKRTVREYYKENPIASVQEVKEETGVTMPLSNIGGIKGNMVSIGSLEGSGSKNTSKQSNEESNDEKDGVESGIEVTLRFDSEEVKDVLSDKNTDVDIKGRVIDKLIEEAMG